ncbi:MAG: ABC transporter permease [Cyanobacteria bacterium P01_E01_bin.6]
MTHPSATIESKTDASTAQGLRPTVFWRIADDIPRSLNWSLMTASVLTPFLTWWLVAETAGINPAFLPSPADVGEAFARLWDRGFLIQDTLASFSRVMGGFLLAAIISAPIGILMGTFSSISALFEPIIGIFRYMPAPAFTPLLIIYLGLDEAPKISLVILGVVFYNILMIMDAVKFVPKELIEATYTLGGRRPQILLQVITPHVLPNIIDAFRINMAAAWNMVIVAELIAADAGLGKRIQIAQKFFNTDEIFACLIVLGVIGVSLDLLFRWLLRFTCKWAID